MSHETEYASDDVFKNVIPGNRVVELGYVLKWSIQMQFFHSKKCRGLFIPFKEESRGHGLVRHLHFKCTMCQDVTIRATEDPKNGSEINIGAVWGTLATGNTYSHLEEQLACMNVPPISKTIFLQIENNLGKVKY